MEGFFAVLWLSFKLNFIVYLELFFVIYKWPKFLKIKKKNKYWLLSNIEVNVLWENIYRLKSVICNSILAIYCQ